MRKLGVVAMVACIALVIGLPGPAGASVTGATVFNCNVSLPVWPTANGPAVNCVGKTTGYLQGQTTAPAKAYRVAAANSSFIGAAAKYSETCVFNEPLNGKANGSFSASGLRSITPAGTASSSGTAFVWTRIGSSALINLTGGTIFLPMGKQAKGSRGTSAAAFAPTSPIPPGTCTKPKPLKATIVGVAIFQS
ncbi:MAG: hypothetical protein ACRDKS_16645 [Actinomycetota bacterium]